MASRREMQFVLKFRAEAAQAMQQIRSQFTNVASASKQMGQAATQASQAATKQTNALNNSLSQSRRSTMGLVGDFRNLKGIITTVGLAYFAKELVGVSREMDRVRAKINFTFSGAQVDGIFAKTAKEANALGLNILTLTSQYGSFMAASKATGLEVKVLDEVFFGVAKAATALQLPAEQVEGAFFAIQQMMAKGKVMSEEFRLQLAERLPIAMLAATRATGLTTAEFQKMLENGEIISSEFLPKFGRELAKLSEGSLAEAAQSLNAEFGRLSNTWQSFLTSVNEGGFGDSFKGLLREVNAMSDTFDSFGKDIGAILGVLGELVKYLVGTVAGAFAMFRDVLVGTVDWLKDLYKWLLPREAEAWGVVINHVKDMAKYMALLAGNYAKYRDVAKATAVTQAEMGESLEVTTDHFKDVRRVFGEAGVGFTEYAKGAKAAYSSTEDITDVVKELMNTPMFKDPQSNTQMSQMTSQMATSILEVGESFKKIGITAENEANKIAKAFIGGNREVLISLLDTAEAMRKLGQVSDSDFADVLTSLVKLQEQLDNTRQSTSDLVAADKILMDRYNGDLGAAAIGKRTEELKKLDKQMKENNISLRDRVEILKGSQRGDLPTIDQAKAQLELNKFIGDMEDAIKAADDARRKADQEAKKRAEELARLQKKHDEGMFIGLLPEFEGRIAEANKLVTEVEKHYAEMDRLGAKYAQDDKARHMQLARDKRDILLREVKWAQEDQKNGNWYIQYLPDKEKTLAEAEASIVELNRLILKNRDMMDADQIRRVEEVQTAFEERTRKDARKAVEKAEFDETLKQLRESQNIVDQAAAAWMELEKAMRDTNGAMADIMKDAFEDMRSGLAEFIVTGKADFASMIQSWAKNLAELALNDVFLQIFGKGGTGTNDSIGTFLKSLVFHGGGKVSGAGARTRAVNPMMFANAPRFHNGLRPDEFPAILQRGETVIPRGESSSRGSGTSINAPVSVQVSINGGGANGATSPEQAKMIGNEIARSVEAKVKEVLLKESRQGGMLTTPRGSY